MEVPDKKLCGNCSNWYAEVFAWGVCHICRISYHIKRAQDICDLK